MVSIHSPCIQVQLLILLLVPVHFLFIRAASYVFDDADHAASLFNLQSPWLHLFPSYKPQMFSALEEKLATLEGGRGGTATSSGHAAEGTCPLPLNVTWYGSFLLQTNSTEARST
ncbi:MAG: hypothetical protein Ct9H300mP28_21790 [Pseudomonadota bacterium]|nr:MAG: hypothetical protein Ct9H300mP28_21790 [Pseudomonadota bacterium]